MDERDPIDAIGPWTIKAVATRTRQKVMTAARREGLTVGQWLEKRVEEWETDGSPVPTDADQPAHMNRDGLDDMQRIAEVFATLAGAGLTLPQKQVDRLVRVVGASIPVPRSSPPRRPPLAIEG